MNSCPGLASMRRRARQLEAELDIDSQPGEGTRVRLLIPVPALGRQGFQRGAANSDGLRLIGAAAASS